MGERPAQRSVLVWPLAMLALGAIYLLSTGPAVVLRDSGVISREVFFRIYAPIGWLYKTVPFFGDAVERYAELCLALAGLLGVDLP